MHLLLGPRPLWRPCHKGVDLETKRKMFKMGNLVVHDERMYQMFREELEKGVKMGNWVIHIEGHGIHDNNRRDDADEMLKNFVESLKKSQQVDLVTFTVGSARDLDEGVWKFRG